MAWIHKHLRGWLGITGLQRRVRLLERGESYEALAKLSDRYSQAADSQSDLRLSEMRVFSQNGEDGIICALLTLMDVPEFFVEFGVGDGSVCNTRFLAEVLGWSGVYFEVEREACKRLAKRYSNTGRITVKNVAVSSDNIGRLFDGCGVPHSFGILSIDVDGQDIWLWRSLPNEYCPAIVVIEYNAGLDRDTTLSEPRGIGPAFSEMSGASLGALEVVAKEKGYHLVHTEIAGVNAFFVRHDLAEASGPMRGIVDRSPNYGLRGFGHAPDQSGRGLVDIRVTD